MSALRPMLLCPGCNDAPLPNLGERCATVHGVRCFVRRCWRCAALTWRSLRCEHCGGVQPPELALESVELPEEAKRDRSGTWPATRVSVVVDLAGSGCAWVQADAWSRLRDSPYSARLVKQVALELDPVGVELVGKFTRNKADRATIEASWALGRTQQCPELLAELDGRAVRLVNAREEAFADVRPPRATMVVQVADVLEVLETVSRKTTRFLLTEHAIEVSKDGHTLTPVERLDEAAALLRELLRPLVRHARARCDLSHREVMALERLVEREAGDGRRRCWAPAAVWGKSYCGGGACPGMSRRPSSGEPHPATCLAAGESAEDVLERVGFGYTDRGTRLCIDFGARLGSAPLEQLDAAEVARRDAEAAPWLPPRASTNG